jgi:serralysin
LNNDAYVAGTAALDAEDRFIYDPATGALRFDPDGTGAQPSVFFADLPSGLALNRNDFEIV